MIFAREIAPNIHPNIHHIYKEIAIAFPHPYLLVLKPSYSHARPSNPLTLQHSQELHPAIHSYSSRQHTPTPKPSRPPTHTAG